LARPQNKPQHSPRIPSDVDAWGLACLLVLGPLLAPPLAAQDLPRTLPQPEIPLSPLTPSDAASGADARALPYVGPPAAIDGPLGVPERLPPATGEFLPEGSLVPEGLITPGLVPDDLAPFVDDPLLLEDPYYGTPQRLTEYRNTFFQKLSLSATWFGNGSDPEDLGATEIETYLTVAVPAPIVEWPLLITPSFNVAYLQGPGVTDLPPRLFFTYIDFMWVPQIMYRTQLVLSVAPSVLSDFEASNSDAFRLTGKALVKLDLVPDHLQFVAGVLYLNRDNVRLLPAGGFFWRPTEWLNLELIFPKPKAAVRINVGTGFEDWLFTTAEFGGNTWAILRENGDKDKVTYLDYRLLTGIERKLNGGAGFRLEAGYVFGRDIEFASGVGNFEPKNTVMIRGAIVF
jgi:hypothetical protein